MKQLSILLMAFSLALFSCEKDTDSQETLTGTYTGTFQRIHNGAAGPLSGVTLTFTTNGFSGGSDSSYYPAICKGTYSIEGNTVNFENSCVWPAHFDWTLILNGEYRIETNGDNLELRKYYNGTVQQEDVYKLVKQQ